MNNKQLKVQLAWLESKMAGCLKELARVPKLLLGNPDGETRASRDGKLELPAPNSQAGAWELAYGEIAADFKELGYACT